MAQSIQQREKSFFVPTLTVNVEKSLQTLTRCVSEQTSRNFLNFDTVKDNNVIWQVHMSHFNYNP